MQFGEYFLVTVYVCHDERKASFSIGSRPGLQQQPHDGEMAASRRVDQAPMSVLPRLRTGIEELLHDVQPPFERRQAHRIVLTGTLEHVGAGSEQYPHDFDVTAARRATDGIVLLGQGTCPLI